MTSERPEDKTGERISPSQPGMGLAFAALGVTLLVGTLGQHLTAATGGLANGSTRGVIVGVGFLAFSITVTLGFYRTWFRFLSSNLFAVPAVVMLTALSIAGTLVLQGEPEATLRNAYGSALLAIQALFLHDIFHSFAFVALLGVTAGGLTLTVVRKRRVTLRTAGAVASHAGLLVILVGVAIGNIWSVKGRLPLHEGQGSDRFFVDAGDQVEEVPLGFTFRLDDFELERYEPAFRLGVFEIRAGEQKRLAVAEPNPDANEALAVFGVEVVDYWPDHVRETRVTPIPSRAEGLNLAALGINFAETDNTEWLFDDGRPGGGLLSLDRREVRFFWDEQRATAYLRGEAKPTHVLIAGDRRLPVEPGSVVSLPGGGVGAHGDIELEVRRALIDFVIDGESGTPGDRSDLPNNPAIEIVIRDTNGVELGKRWLFAKFPQFHDQDDSPLANLRYEYAGGSSAGQDASIAVGQTAELWRVQNGEVTAITPLAPGTRLPLGVGSPSVGALHAAVERSYTNATRSARADNPMVAIRVDGKTELLGPKASYPLGPDKVLALVPKGGESVRDYLSTVSVFENDRRVLTATVEVNRPLTHRGFVFYQADYRPEDLSFSGFQVVADPGLWVVYSGFGATVAGVAWAVLVPALLRRRQRARSGASRNAGPGPTTGSMRHRLARDHEGEAA